MAITKQPLPRHRLWVAFVMSAICGSWIDSAQAETYLAGQAGLTLATDTARGRAVDPTYAGLPAGTSISSVKLDDSVMYGVKLGHYFDSLSWLGVELEAFMTTPHRPQQRLTLGIPGAGAVTYEEAGATNRLVVVSPNLVVRYQAGALEPYLGIGPGVFFLHQHQEPLMPGGKPYSQSYTGVGLNAQAGLRCHVTAHVSLFGEWKYNYARINLPGQADAAHFGINAVVSLHHVVFGVGYHF